MSCHAAATVLAVLGLCASAQAWYGLHAGFALEDRPNYCNKAADPGPCRAGFRRWYFNLQSGECETYTWGGCKETRNSFEDEGKCKLKCRDKYLGRSTGTGSAACKMPPNEGVGRKSAKSFYYDSRNGWCSQFTYKGRGGNDNRFPSVEVCLQQCDPEGLRRSGNVCAQPIDQGLCGVGVEDRPQYEWWYDPRDGQCKQSLFGSCYRSGNRFGSKEVCKLQCKGFYGPPLSDFSTSTTTTTTTTAVCPNTGNNTIQLPTTMKGCDTLCEGKLMAGLFQRRPDERGCYNTCKCKCARKISKSKCKNKCRRKGLIPRWHLTYGVYDCRNVCQCLGYQI